jgi:hypothetical protein
MQSTEKVENFKITFLYALYKSFSMQCLQIRFDGTNLFSPECFSIGQIPIFKKSLYRGQRGGLVRVLSFRTLLDMILYMDC